MRMHLYTAQRCSACSAALQLSGRLQVAVGGTFVGLRLRGTVHTNSGFKLSATYGKSGEEAMGVKLNYELQPQATEVLNIECVLLLLERQRYSNSFCVACTGLGCISRTATSRSS